MPNSIAFRLYIKFLLHIGCVEVRQKGSHKIFRKEGCKRPIVVPSSKSHVFPDVVNSNLKTLSISYKEFLEITKKLS